MKINNKLALAALLAAPQSSWSFGPDLGSRFFPPGALFIDSPAARLTMPGGAMSSACRSLHQSLPRYEVVDNDDIFRLAVNVPGVKMEDVNVSFEDSVLTVSGHRESLTENSRFTSHFSQRFSLDPSVDVDKFTANLENGVLIVSAPKDLKRIEENIRKIPISSGTPSTLIGSVPATAAAAVGVDITESTKHAGDNDDHIDKPKDQGASSDAAAESSTVSKETGEQDEADDVIDLDA